ncbi:hypothetical protein NEUTE2DRAFT_62282 [Neurospora tetrasperma FGSC 2509]|nr:hypothetical protein NEUTE2DRAFT_62282 [Neurospora tetrasperma FGSC 2509]
MTSPAPKKRKASKANRGSSALNATKTLKPNTSTTQTPNDASTIVTSDVESDKNTAATKTSVIARTSKSQITYL